MTRQVVGLVIRTAFNNQGWAGRCINPLGDNRCFKCREGGLYINKGNPIEEDETGYCKGEPEEYPLYLPEDGDEAFWCWEQVLCKKYFWGNVKGKWREAFKGMPVYFVYAEENRTLTLWGHSVIDKINDEPKRYPPIFFKSFKPLPQDKWVKGLTGEKITGSSWRQLHYRYLDERHENYLSSLVKGEGKLKPLTTILHSEGHETLNFQLKKDIKEKLGKIANNEGREIEDIIREAVAKLIRDRGF